MTLPLLFPLFIVMLICHHHPVQIIVIVSLSSIIISVIIVLWSPSPVQDRGRWEGNDAPHSSYEGEGWDQVCPEVLPLRPAQGEDAGQLHHTRWGPLATHWFLLTLCVAWYPTSISHSNFHFLGITGPSNVEGLKLLTISDSNPVAPIRLQNLTCHSNLLFQTGLALVCRS